MAERKRKVLPVTHKLMGYVGSGFKEIIRGSHTQCIYQKKLCSGKYEDLEIVKVSARKNQYKTS